MLHSCRSPNAWFVIAAPLYFLNLWILLKGSSLLKGTPSLPVLKVSYITTLTHERKLCLCVQGKVTSDMPEIMFARSTLNTCFKRVQVPSGSGLSVPGRALIPAD